MFEDYRRIFWSDPLKVGAIAVMSDGDNTKDIAEAFYDDFILRKDRPKVLYLFFGHYASMDQARKSRNNMPKFLRDNQPYVLSIKDALEKIKQ